MYKTKICPICGTEFQPKSARQKYCNNPVIRKCVICGKSYTSICNPTYSSCCSKECTTQYAHQQSASSYAKTTKVCILCGKEFIPKNNTQVICSDQHYRSCAICGKQFPIKWRSGRNVNEIAKTCSPECRTKLAFANGNPFNDPTSREKAKQTMLERYGVDHPMHSEEIKSKVDKTSIERYGAKRFTQTSEYIEKATATNQQRYGADWARQNPEIQKKSEDTLLTHYGVTNPMQSEELKAKVSETYKERTGYDTPMHNPEVIEKIKQSNLEKYGVEHVLQSPEIKAKAIESNLQRWGGLGLGSEVIRDKIQTTNEQKYGVKNPANTPEVQAKISATMLSRYGVSHYNESWDYRAAHMTDPTKVADWKAFLDDPDLYVAEHFDHKPNYLELANALGVNDATIQVHLSRMGKSDLVQYTLSYLENELVDILKDINSDMQILRHNRDLIKPYEIDIYLPEYKIGIEVNPTGTHNSSVGSHNHSPKAPSYHRMKTNMCEQQGIFLFHIFGYEWTHKKEIIISMLRNLIGCNSQVIYARKCEVRQLASTEAFEFLQANHRQGGVHSKYRYGLYYNGDLVSVMTFGKMRNTLGLGSEDLSDCWELVRYCNKLNTTVVGGASRLFKHFVADHQPVRVRSFSDRAHTKGGLYRTLGFTEVARNPESYVWVNLTDNKAYNRVSTQKQHLRTFFHDDTIDLSKTEREIMESHGYVQVFDSGTITWEWRLV